MKLRNLLLLIILFFVQISYAQENKGLAHREYKIAENNFNAKKYTSCISHLDTVVKLMGKSGAPIFYLKTKAYNGLKDYKLAYKYVEKYLNTAPDKKSMDYNEILNMSITIKENYNRIIEQEQKEKNKYLQAKQINTYKSLSSFNTKYPNSIYTDSIKTIIKGSYKRWGDVSYIKNDLDSIIFYYEQYLKDNKSNDILIKLQKTYYNKSLTYTDTKKAKKFLNKAKNISRDKTTNELINKRFLEIKNIKKEEELQAYNKAIQGNTIYYFNTYLDKYPKGSHYNKIKDQKEKMIYTNAFSKAKESSKIKECEAFISKYSVNENKDDINEIKIILTKKYKELGDKQLSDKNYSEAKVSYESLKKYCTNDECRKNAEENINTVNRKISNIGVWEHTFLMDGHIVLFGQSKYEFTNNNLKNITDSIDDNPSTGGMLLNLSIGASHIYYMGSNNYKNIGLDYSLNLNSVLPMSRGYKWQHISADIRIGGVLATVARPYLRVNIYSQDKLFIDNKYDYSINGTLLDVKNDILIAPGIKLQIPITYDIYAFIAYEGIKRTKSFVIAESLLKDETSEYDNKIIVTDMIMSDYKYRYISYGIVFKAFKLSVENYTKTAFTPNTSNKIYYQNSFMYTLTFGKFF